MLREAKEEITRLTEELEKEKARNECRAQEALDEEKKKTKKKKVPRSVKQEWAVTRKSGEWAGNWGRRLEKDEKDDSATEIPLSNDDESEQHGSRTRSSSVEHGEDTSMELYSENEEPTLMSVPGPSNMSVELYSGNEEPTATHPNHGGMEPRPVSPWSSQDISSGALEEEPEPSSRKKTLKNKPGAKLFAARAAKLRDEGKVRARRPKSMIEVGPPVPDSFLGQTMVLALGSQRRSSSVATLPDINMQQRFGTGRSPVLHGKSGVWDEGTCIEEEAHLTSPLERRHRIRDSIGKPSPKKGPNALSAEAKEVRDLELRTLNEAHRASVAEYEAQYGFGNGGLPKRKASVAKRTSRKGSKDVRV